MTHGEALDSWRAENCAAIVAARRKVKARRELLSDREARLLSARELLWETVRRSAFFRSNADWALSQPAGPDGDAAEAALVAVWGLPPGVWGWALYDLPFPEVLAVDFARRGIALVDALDLGPTGSPDLLRRRLPLGWTFRADSRGRREVVAVLPEWGRRLQILLPTLRWVRPDEDVPSTWDTSLLSPAVDALEARGARAVVADFDLPRGRYGYRLTWHEDGTEIPAREALGLLSDTLSERVGSWRIPYPSQPTARLEALAEYEESELRLARGGRAGSPGGADRDTARAVKRAVRALWEVEGTASFWTHAIFGEESPFPRVFRLSLCADCPAAVGCPLKLGEKGARSSHFGLRCYPGARLSK